MRMDAGPVRIGSQGGNTLMHSLLDSRSALFEGVEGGRVKAVKGISLGFDVASFFFLTSPRFITGFSLDIGGFLLGYAHAAADTIDDEYFLSYNERRSSFPTLPYPLIFLFVQVFHSGDCHLHTQEEGRLSCLEAGR